MKFMGFDVTYAQNTKVTPATLDYEYCTMSYNIFYLPVLDSGHILALSGYQDNAGVSRIYTYDTSESYLTRWRDYSYYESAWKNTIRVTGWNPSSSDEWCNWVSVGDISSFSASHDHPKNWGVEHVDSLIDIYFTISPSADTAYAKFYIADNAYGPRRLLHQELVYPDSSYHLEIDLYPYNDFYNIYMSHEDGILIEADYPDDETCLDFRYWNPSMFGHGRPVFNPPDSLSVSDVPSDDGGAIALDWNLSSSDSLIDCYNIYRAADIMSEMKYLASVNPGVSSYTDTTALGGVDYFYRITSAHHGDLYEKDGNFGLWNEWNSAMPDTVRSINNFRNSITFASYNNDSMFVCPSGDGDTLKLEVEVMGEDSNCTEGISKESILLFAYDDYQVNFGCDSLITAIDSTDQYGESTFELSKLGGCDTFYIYATVSGVMSMNSLELCFRSADMDGDGDVDLSDQCLFTDYLWTDSSDSNFCPCADYNYDDYCNLSDFGYIGDHWQHACPVSSGRPLLNASLNNNLQLEFVTNEVTAEELLEVKVFLNGASDVTDLAILLDNEISGLEFLRWDEKTATGRRSLALACVNNGNKVARGSLCSKTRPVCLRGGLIMQLEGLLEKLKMDHLSGQLESVCKQAAKRELAYKEFLAEALRTEWNGRHLKGVESRMRQARLPMVKTIEQFDFSFQPSIDRKVIRELAALSFVERAENVVFLGPPGVGKTHLAIALGIKAIEAGHRVLFLSLEALLIRLSRAKRENRLERQLQQLVYPRVLILDEMGYLPMSR